MKRPIRRYVFTDLLDKWNWFDQSLQDVLRSANFMGFTDSQSKMLLWISQGVTRPSDIAEKMRMSLQAIRHTANQLIKRGVLVSRVDPSDRRSRIITYTKSSDRVRDYANDVLRDLEREIALRIGEAEYNVMVKALAKDWGPRIKKRSELPFHTNGVSRRKAAARNKKRKREF